MDYITKSSIKNRGWTESAINRFLGDPDMERPNPYSGKKPPMKLYAEERVIKAEQSDDFNQWCEKSKNRRKGAKKAVETKRAKLMNEVRNWEIEIGVSTSFDEVIHAAIAHFNERLIYYENRDLERGKEYFVRDRASIHSDKDFLDRITVNYIRHELSVYDEKIDDLFGKIGKHEAFELLNQKIYTEIGRVFPQLREEAQRQLKAKIKQREIIMKAETVHPSSEIKTKDLAMDLIRDAGMGLEASDYLELLGNVISECLVEIEDHGTRDAQKVLRRAITDFQAALDRMEKTGSGTTLN